MEGKILGDFLDMQVSENIASCVYDSEEIAAYSLSEMDYLDRRIDMGDFDFPGFVYLNMTFFHRLFPPKHPKSTSKFMNIAKHFFKFNRKNHVCLVQYCPPGGHSSEHYHSLDEYIGCIAGSVNIRLALAGNPTDKTNIFLKAGGVVHILPETLHFLSSEEGSVTIPIKQTIKGKKDHFYQKP